MVLAYWPLESVGPPAHFQRYLAGLWPYNGQTIAFAEDTKLCAAILVGPQDVVWNGGEVCTLPSGEEVNFYQVIPLYRNEMEYKMEHDADALLEKMAGISFVVNPTRQNAITRGTLAEEEFTGDMDDAAWHLESIQEKGLPVNEINAYNHMAIYLRWCIEHDLMSAEFMERYWEQVQPFMADLSRADLRGFIRDQLKGQLFGALFNKEGAALLDITTARRIARTSPVTLITMLWSISVQSNIIPISSRMKPICSSHLMKTIIRLWQKSWKSGSPTGRDRVSMRPLWSLQTLRKP